MVIVGKPGRYSGVGCTQLSPVNLPGFTPDTITIRRQEYFPRYECIAGNKKRSLCIIMYAVNVLVVAGVGEIVFFFLFRHHPLPGRIIRPTAARVRK